MNKWLWSLLCVTLLGAAACSDDDTEGDSGNPIPPALSTENLPDAGLKFLYSALTPHTFTMNVDAPWEITKTAGWFVVTPNKGEAGQNIQVTVTPTLNQGEARDGEFTIRANSGNNLHPCLTQKSIPLSQDAYLAAGIVITGLDERLLAFEAEDTDPVVFTVEASYDWTLTVENETWLTVAPKSGKAGSAAEVTITPKANTTDERRESKITITAGDAEFGENTAEEIIELVQAPSASALHFEWSFPATAEENNLVSRTERWYKSDDGKARIDAVRAVDNPSNPDMSYSLGYDNEIGRILMYGFALDDYWLFTLPVKNFKANTTLNLRALISSSASGPKFYILEYSADGQASWTSVNTTSIEDKSAKDTALRTIVYTHMMPDTPANGDVIVDDDITIPTAVADGNIYLRLRVCDAMAGNKAKNIVPANGGTTRMKTKEGICDAISVTEVQR